ncbi:hypothetical protein DFH07DRAFT_768490 [Mycena maculata]|uniref:Uncharacterized protein n=1 Tax=Mycena maculata TaxID=230809 RepID=A0AAD7NQD3_9AGAR|nr:hypothetical protein DFH07DRAFT_768490 [Mycena maculata]
MPNYPCILHCCSAAAALPQLVATNCCQRPLIFGRSESVTFSCTFGSSRNNTFRLLFWLDPKQLLSAPISATPNPSRAFIFVGVKQFKEAALAAATAEERAEIEAHWPMDDMDENYILPVEYINSLEPACLRIFSDKLFVSAAVFMAAGPFPKQEEEESVDAAFAPTSSDIMVRRNPRRERATENQSRPEPNLAWHGSHSMRWRAIPDVRVTGHEAPRSPAFLRPVWNRLFYFSNAISGAFGSLNNAGITLPLVDPQARRQLSRFRGMCSAT